MKELKGTKTEANLQAAFAGESQARNKYTYFASKAKAEGYEQIAALFLETANNEKEHAKIWFKLLNGGEIGTTADNLKEAAAGENYEWTDMYKTFAEEAREEGFDDVARLFDNIARIEKDHELRFMNALMQLNSSRKESQPSAQPTQKRMVTVQGHRCVFCGALYDKCPDVCSVCGAIGSFEATEYQKEL